ncbi:chromate transporter [Arthrobacter sp. 92]|uniref:chromate transporter n=1 Tax=Arthrobacter sp. 92 TaxID=3418175 RepID=UPI003D091D3B
MTSGGGPARDGPGDDAPEPAIAAVPFRRIVLYFLHLGTTGFGGPIATVGYMQRDLVEKRRWIGRKDFLDGVALGQTMPGPLAAQVAMWVGYLNRGPWGALAVAAAFSGPAFIIVVAFLVQNGTLVPINSSAFVSIFAGTVGPFRSEVLIFVVVTLAAAALMRWSILGRRLYALGGNAQAARLSGLPVNRDIITAYLLSGLLAGLAGLMLAAQLREGNSLLGSELALNSIAAAVVGGASLFGGGSTDSYRLAHTIANRQQDN